MPRQVEEDVKGDWSMRCQAVRHRQDHVDQAGLGFESADQEDSQSFAPRKRIPPNELL